MLVSKKQPFPLLVTGASGMLGSDLVEEIVMSRGRQGVLSTDSKTLDITHRTQVENFLHKNPISYIINAAAYTDVDGAEKEREKAYLINVVGPKNLAEVAGSFGIPVIHFSTDYVFDGTLNRPLTEEDEPNPPKPNYYGETKLLGEREVLQNPANLVLRVQWLYGKRRERFSSLRNKEKFTPFEDQWGAPTWTRDVSRTVVKLIEQKAKGLFHFAYDDFASWAEVFAFVCDEWHLSTQLLPKKSSDINLPARRPSYGVMANRKLLAQLGEKTMGSWQTSLREFLKTIYCDFK